MNRNLHIVLVLMVILELKPALSYSQCTRTAPAARTCPIATGTAIIADGVTNNNVHGSGAVFYYNGSGGSAKISMTNDGILDVCGSLTVTAASTFNLSSGGTIQVESGGTLIINTDVTLNNTGQIVNRGTLTINGNISVTNTNATIWNLPNSQSFSLGSGKNITMLAGYFINNAPFSLVNFPTFNLTGGFVCMGDNTFINTVTFKNTVTNSVLYSGTTLPACLGVSSSAQIGGQTLTNNSHINVSLSAAFTYASGTAANWGSATVLTSSVGCSSVVPIRIVQFSAVQQNDKIAIRWNTAGGFNDQEFFEIERSDDGINFHRITTVEAKQNTSNYLVYDSKVTASVSYYRIKHVMQNGSFTYSNIEQVSSDFSEGLITYPNPASVGSNINFRINSKNRMNFQLHLFDLSGKSVIMKSGILANEQIQLSMGSKNIVAGTYILKIQSSDNVETYEKLVVLTP